LKGRKLLPGLLHKLRVWIGMCPESEEMLVGINGRGAIALCGQRASDAEPERVMAEEVEPASGCVKGIAEVLFCKGGLVDG
jgi:hypothetical protein